MGMGMGMPFSDDVITLFMGLGDPCEPGMHGSVKEPCPTDDAVELVCKIRDMCDEWLRSAGKCGNTGEKPKKPEQAPAPTEVGDTSEEE